jgi:hypothetical protein
MCGLQLTTWTLPDREAHADACLVGTFGEKDGGGSGGVGDGAVSDGGGDGDVGVHGGRVATPGVRLVTILAVVIAFGYCLAK